MFALLRPLLIAVAIIIFLSYALGIIKYEKPSYGCYHGRKLGFTDKTKVLEFGNFNVYAYPLIADCPEDDRFNPDQMTNCGYNELVL
jgi:hypothetical protein